MNTDHEAAADRLPLGATFLNVGMDAAMDACRCAFNLWAPTADAVTLHLHDPDRAITLQPGDRGYYSAIVDGIAPGARYSFRLDDGPDRPDPASRSQPDGPHAPSAVFDAAAFEWTDRSWRGLPLAKYIIYELHVGAFTPEGTFDAVIPHLDSLRDLGITVVELMPIAQFPGARNWGYDGVGLFAAQNSYGGPEGLRRLVDACHARGLAIALDVVYNHLGPEGNYLAQFGPYFTDRYSTPWGPALNFDGEWSDEVRRFFIESALYWVTDLHIDALRLDAVHAIVDPSSVPFVQELCAAVHQRAAALGRHIHCIAESAANDARLITPTDMNGLGADAQWNDDFHHALRTTLTDERRGYYAGYRGLEHLHKALEHGYVFTGEHDPFRNRRHGSPSRHLPGERFVVFHQNHDQVGNRMLGERLGALVPFESLKLAAAVTALSPFIPLFFMGEEYAEPAPFLYFVSHTDPALVEAVRRGRVEEFASFNWRGRPPDPQSEDTFTRSRLDLSLRRLGRHAALLAFYTDLLRLRREHPALALLNKQTLRVARDDRARTLTLHRWTPSEVAPSRQAALLLNFAPPGGGEPLAAISLPPGRWRLALDSLDTRYGGTGDLRPALVDSGSDAPIHLPPLTVVLYDRED